MAAMHTSTPHPAHPGRRSTAKLRLAADLLTMRERILAGWLIMARVLLGASDIALAGSLYLLFVLLKGDSPAPASRWLPHSLLAVSLLSLALLLLRVAVEIWGTWALVRFTQAIYKDFMMRLTEGYTAMNWNRLVENNRATMARHTIHTALDAAYSFQLYIEATSGMIVAVMMAVALIYQSPVIAAMLGGSAAAMYLAHRLLLQGWMRQAGAEREQSLRILQVAVTETFSLVREIRTYANQLFFIDRVSTQADRLVASNVQLATLPQGFRVLTENAPIVILLGLVLWTEISHGSTQSLLGILVFYFVLSRRFFPVLAQLALTSGQLEGADETLQTISAELRSCADHRASIPPALPPDPGNVLQISDLHFSFGSNTDILDGLQLDLAHGEIAVIAGPSGCGKSTLLTLIAGVSQQRSGEIRVDRASLAYVPQETVLLDSCVRSNLAFGASATDEAIWRSLRAVNLDQLVEAMPQGLATRVGDNGLLLSGGQRQRFGLARALLRNASLLLLDEATSALDLANEAEILDRLSHRGVAILMVTHRNTSNHFAARHYTLENGRLRQLSVPFRAES